MNRKTAIITGASSGLGREYLHQLLNEPTIEEYWIIARRENILNQLKEQDEKRIRPVPMDLTDQKAMEKFIALLKEEQPDVRWLISNAGMGRIGTIEETSQEDTARMIDLNCRAAAEITQAVLPYCSRGSIIMEVCSTAAFQPMPGLAVYAATKSFLHSYTKALHHEVLSKGIHVTAVCPYWIKDTAFIPTAKQTGHAGFRHTPLASKSESVVRISLRDAKHNLWVSTPGIVCTLDRFTAKFIPHFIVVPIMDLVRKI